MNNLFRFRILIAALLLALFAGAALPGTAFADDGVPPVAEEPAPPPDDGGDLAPEEPAAEEPAAEETPAVEETPAADEGETVEAEAPVSEEEAPAEDSIIDLPEGTDLVVLDENGEPLALGSQEAAELIEIIDPIWCPVGVTPQIGAGCSATFASLSALVAGFIPTGNGVIWIEAGPDSGATVEIDGTIGGGHPWEAARNFTLTFKGGWNGTLGSTATNPATPSEFDTQISIHDWNNDITLSDIAISGYVGTAPLYVETTGKVTLTRVEVSGNSDDGAVIDNSSGTKDVVITSSEFGSNPTGSGLFVTSSGNITLSNVTANNNGGYGATLENCNDTNPPFGPCADAKNVTLTGSNFFNENSSSGLRILSGGIITVAGVQANQNSSNGADLDNSLASSAKNVTLSGGTLQFNGNLGDFGLLINSTGLISLKDVDVIGNDTEGAQLVNTYSPTNQGVSLTGANIFSDNGGFGITIVTNGPVTSATALIANSNEGVGAIIDNDGAPSAMAVTLSGTNEFKFNDAGLEIHSDGAITLNNVTANDNTTGDGAWLENNNIPNPGYDVTLTGTNNFLRNGGGRSTGG